MKNPKKGVWFPLVLITLVAVIAFWSPLSSMGIRSYTTAVFSTMECLNMQKLFRKVFW
jgi:hypothetical protein